MLYHTRRRARQAAEKTKTGGDTATKKGQRRSPQKTAIIRLTRPLIFPAADRIAATETGNKPFPAPGHTVHPNNPTTSQRRRSESNRFFRFTGANGEQPAQTQGRGLSAGRLCRLSPHSKTKTAVHAVTDRDPSHPIPQNRRYAQRRMAIDSNQLQYSSYTDINLRKKKSKESSRRRFRPPRAGVFCIQSTACRADDSTRIYSGEQFPPTGFACRRENAAAARNLPEPGGSLSARDLLKTRQSRRGTFVKSGRSYHGKPPRNRYRNLSARGIF